MRRSIAAPLPTYTLSAHLRIGHQQLTTHGLALRPTRLSGPINQRKEPTSRFRGRAALACVVHRRALVGPRRRIGQTTAGLAIV